MKYSTGKAYMVIMDPHLHKNLQRISLAQDTNVSAIIRKASEAYVRDYLQEQKKVEVRAI